MSVRTCEQRFASVEEKRENKNHSRMELLQTIRFIVERKCLGILVLPLVTLNGGTRSANEALGNTLEHFCRFNYQHHTLDKFLRELKYLGLSGSSRSLNWRVKRGDQNAYVYSRQ
jgi:hypothetical protein